MLLVSSQKHSRVACGVREWQRLRSIFLGMERWLRTRIFDYLSIDVAMVLLLDDMRPYERMLSTGVVAGVMLAHIVYREIDDMPAGFSAYWIQRELRSRLGFGGAVFCDDLSMKATAEYGSMGSRARLALDAGCDMILVCNDRAAALQAVGALNDYSNPLSLVRLARLHGTGQQLRESLQASEEWQAANAIFVDWDTPPQLRLDA